MEGLNDVFRNRASFLLRLSQAFPPSSFAPPLCVRVFSGFCSHLFTSLRDCPIQGKRVAPAWGLRPLLSAPFPWVSWGNWTQGRNHQVWFAGSKLHISRGHQTLASAYIDHHTRQPSLGLFSWHNPGAGLPIQALHLRLAVMELTI